MPTQIETDELMMRHGVFLRSARDAARQSLFFLNLLYRCKREPYGRAVESYLDTALHQVKGLIRGVFVPSIYDKLGEVEDAEVARVANLGATWSSIRHDVKERIPLDEIPALRARIIRFLVESRVAGRTKRLFQHHLSDILRWLARHLTLFAAALFVGVISINVEAVHGLLLNEGRWLLLFLVLLPILLYINFFRYWYRKLRGLDPDYVHPWSVGSRPFWSWRPLVIPPGRLVQRWPSGSLLFWAIARSQSIKLLAYLLSAGLAVFAIYYLRQVIGEHSTTVTVPVILLVFYMILLAANELDFWDFISKQPIRFFVLFAAVFCLFFLRIGFGREGFIFLFGLTMILLVLAYVTKVSRSRVVVGGAFTSFAILALLIYGDVIHGKRVWEQDPEQSFTRLGQEGSKVRWPYSSEESLPVVVVAASGGGSRAAVYAALTLQRLHRDLPDIAMQIQAISSVSGGSLANAVYISRLLRSDGNRDDSLEDLVEATSQDFLWPTLFGAVWPGRTRGEEIENAWQDPPVGLEELTLGNLVKRWKEAQDKGDAIPPFPMPLFNTASLDGHDVVISPLARELYDGDGRCRDARANGNTITELVNQVPDDPLTWVFYRDCIYGLEDFLGNTDLLLSSGVLASANFPFGFPVVKVAAESGALIFSPVANEREHVKLTDGGALSNSGLWSLTNLLLDEAHFEELRERGVLVLIIEASRMPTYRSLGSTFNSLLGTLNDQGPIGRNLHNRMLDVLKQRFGDRLVTVQMDLVPRESLNVMTTWALDESSLRDLKDQSFELRWKEEKENLQVKWDFLTKGTDIGIVDTIHRSRPPLD